MSNISIPASPVWNDSINQVETNESILGGANGNANLAVKQLAENLLWLKLNMQAYKVGDVYVTTIPHATAAAVKTHHGYGTWQRHAEGRTLVGFSTKTTDPIDYKTMGHEFGANTHLLSNDELANHTHTFVNSYDGTSTNSKSKDEHDWSSDIVPGSEIIKDLAYGNDGVTDTAFLQETKASSYSQNPHNNIQPSLVQGYWLRTA